VFSFQVKNITQGEKRGVGVGVGVGVGEGEGEYIEFDMLQIETRH